MIAEFGKDYDYILAGATTFGKNILPRVAALLDVSMVSDVMKIIAADTFVRPIYAGNVYCYCTNSRRIKVLTIRTTAFTAVQTIEQRQAAPIEKISQEIANSSFSF